MSDPTIYRNHGVHLAIPSGWTVEEATTADGDVTITVADDVTFWTATLLWERPAVENVLAHAKQAFVEEYDDVEFESVAGKISRRDATGYDAHFTCLELINVVSLRSFRTGRFTAFLMWQFLDQERDHYGPVFQELTDSLDVDQDGDIIIA